MERQCIYAGKGGFDIHVGQNTDLKGAVIASDATPDKNKISTDTLTYSDIANKAEYSASSGGYAYQKGTGVKEKDKGLTPVIGTSAKGDADSATKSAVANGTIEVRSNPNQDISGLNRDTANSLNALGKIFDKKTVQEKQELAKLFGEIAFKAIGDLGLKTGSAEKAVVTAAIGGIMAQLGGSRFASGAAGAGLTEIAMNEIAKITDPAVQQWVAYVLGKAAASLVNGNGQTGGSVAVSKIKNNDLDPEHIADNPVITAALYLLGIELQEQQLIAKKTGEVIATWSEEANGWVNTAGEYIGNTIEEVSNYPLIVSIKVPNKVLKDLTTVDLNLFEKMPGKPPKWIGPLGWYIEKDRGSNHGGSAWKLFNWAGERIATLAEDGKILRK